MENITVLLHCLTTLHFCTSMQMFKCDIYLYKYSSDALCLISICFSALGYRSRGKNISPYPESTSNTCSGYASVHWIKFSIDLILRRTRYGKTNKVTQSARGPNLLFVIVDLKDHSHFPSLNKVLTRGHKILKQVIQSSPFVVTIKTGMKHRNCVIEQKV